MFKDATPASFQSPMRLCLAVVLNFLWRWRDCVVFATENTLLKTIEKRTMVAPGSGQKQRDYDYLFKLVLIGDSGVGKSCLLLRFAVRKIFFSKFPIAVDDDAVPGWASGFNLEIMNFAY